MYPNNKEFGDLPNKKGAEILRWHSAVHVSAQFLQHFYTFLSRKTVRKFYRKMDSYLGSISPVSFPILYHSPKFHAQIFLILEINKLCKLKIHKIF